MRTDHDGHTLYEVEGLPSWIWQVDKYGMNIIQEGLSGQGYFLARKYKDESNTKWTAAGSIVGDHKNAFPTWQSAAVATLERLIERFPQHALHYAMVKTLLKEHHEP